jgi:antitoxin component YwqK of YwqJK toxin-antitoxin module
MLFGTLVLGQKNKVDTIHVNKTAIELIRYSCFHGKIEIRDSDTSYYVNGDFVEKLTYIVMSARSDSLTSYYNNSYCKFYDNNVLMEEGVWMIEFFNGNYKSYYKNGNIRTKGVFQYGAPVGVWELYPKRDKGKVKTIKYRDTCVSSIPK